MTDRASRPSAADALDALYQHRLLSTAQIHEMLARGVRLRQTQRLLADLAARNLVASVRPSRDSSDRSARLWYLTERGAAVVEAAPDRTELRRRRLTAEMAAGRLQAHTLAVNEVGVAFLRAARERGDEFGSASWRHEVAHELSAAPRRHSEFLVTDAVTRYWATSSSARPTIRYRFLELDRATVLMDDLAGKLARYARLHLRWTEYWQADRERRASMPAWPSWYRAFPRVIVVLANRERANLGRRLETLLALCRAEPELQECPDLSISFVLLDDLLAWGPFAPIFRRPEDDRLVNWLGHEADASHQRRSA
jgi:predicted ArsR family transcriptional regulator